MKLFTCIDHDLFWPVGCASVVLAKDRRQAKKLLDEQLVAKGLKPFEKEPYTLVEVKLDKALAIILDDGEY